MLESSFDFSNLLPFQWGVNDENIENDESSNVYSKILEENRAQYNKKKYI